MENYDLRVPYKPVGISNSGYLRISTCAFTGESSPRDAKGRLQFRINPFTKVKDSWTHSPIIEQWFNPKTGQLYTIRDESSSTFDLSWTGLSSIDDATIQVEMSNDAMNKFINKSSGFRSNLADMYRTRQETINMVSSTMNRLGRAMFALRRGNWRGCCGSLGIAPKRVANLHNVPQAWLAYQYGWKPLIEDVHNIVSANLPEAFIRLKAGAANRSLNLDRVYPVPPARENIQGVCNTSLSYRCSVSGEVYAINSALASASQYGLTNPAALAWEALPFSFVVDWFLPLGNYFEAMTSMNGLGVRNMSRTFVAKAELNGRFFKPFYGTTIVNAEQMFPVNAGFSCSSLRHYRDIPVVSYTFPRLQNPLSLVHFSEAASLLATAFRR